MNTNPKNKLCKPANGTVFSENLFLNRIKTTNEKISEKTNTIKKDKRGRLTANSVKKSKSPNPNTSKIFFLSFIFAYPQRIIKMSTTNEILIPTFNKNTIGC